ncbi:iron ABC transporter permease [Pelotomaculum terephthalicicum JT]|uniref:FecCD family ABC transporter permease n=1 Tax=Pelotomaculum TaxID=191373 RepID=UPI0009CDB56D|nr:MULTISPECIES: iron ABC transporter permease [Pelotomaculum]MCG9969439.1 iron ABC transporter permease [Pelotomaculum terephthalicicum JT]OPX91511.1 MAG: putative heme-iron transport system permease protein IsdF [Pelotomaculum sp. PtaB.Bin117]OPY63754.1 MAG: putative heme-iron transport system permease protein IsdF [Pelotomaculum sp. PtaU1.Bin065]
MKKTLTSFVVLWLLLAGLIFASVNLGSIRVSLPELLKGLFVAYNENVAVVFDLRFPRIIIAVLSGAALAVSGVLFQAVMKNPLADPGIIGISAGASFAAVLVTMFFPAWFFFSPIFAFGGGVVACFLVYSLSWKSGLTPLRIILVGIAVNAVFSGLLEAVNYMTGGRQSVVAAIVGANISMKTWDDVHTLVWYVLVGLLGALAVSGRCNLLSLEDKTVRNLGVNVHAVRVLVSAVAVLLAGIATAVAGVISFVGLIVPHIARLLVGSNHRTLIPFSILLGSFTVLLADTAGRVIAAPYEIPASIVMAVIGGPFFIFLLRRSDKTYGN